MSQSWYLIPFSISPSNHSLSIHLRGRGLVPGHRTGIGSVLWKSGFQFNSVALSCPTLRPHGLQLSRPPCPSPTPGVYSDSRPSNHLILCRPLLLPPSILPSIRGFSNESVLCIRWPKYWSFSFSISPSSEHPGLISFRMDWLDILAV